MRLVASRLSEICLQTSDDARANLRCIVSRSFDLLEILSEEPEFSAEETTDLSVGCREEDLALSGQGDVPQVIEQRQDVYVVNVRHRIVENDYLRGRPQPLIHRKKQGQSIGGPLPRTHLLKAHGTTTVPDDFEPVLRTDLELVRRVNLRKCRRYSNRVFTQNYLSQRTLRVMTE